MARSDRRLSAELDLLGPGSVMADVGAGDLDLCRLAVAGGRFERAIALERGEPYLRALRQVPTMPGVEVRLSDGMAAVAPGEAGHVAMGGFGAHRMAALLLRQADRFRAAERVVVCPRGAPVPVRHALAAIGMRRAAERLVAEGPRLAWVIAAVPSPTPVVAPGPRDLELGLDLAPPCGAEIDLVARYARGRLAHLERGPGLGGERRARADAVRAWLSAHADPP